MKPQMIQAMQRAGPSRQVRSTDLVPATFDAEGWEIEELTAVHSTARPADRRIGLVIAALAAVVAVGLGGTPPDDGESVDRAIGGPGATPSTAPTAAPRDPAARETVAVVSILEPLADARRHAPVVTVVLVATRPLVAARVVASVGGRELAVVALAVDRAGEHLVDVPVPSAPLGYRLDLAVLGTDRAERPVRLATTTISVAPSAAVTIDRIETAGLASGTGLAVSGDAPVAVGPVALRLLASGRVLAEAEAGGAGLGWGDLGLDAGPFRVVLAAPDLAAGTALTLEVSWLDPATGRLVTIRRPVIVPGRPRAAAPASGAVAADHPEFDPTQR